MENLLLPKHTEYLTTRHPDHTDDSKPTKVEPNIKEDPSKPSTIITIIARFKRTERN